MSILVINTPILFRLLFNLCSVLQKSILEIRRKQRASSWETYKEGIEPKFIQFEDEFKKELEQIKKFYENPSKVSRSN